MTPSIFAFTGFSAVFPNIQLEVQAPLLRLRFLGGICTAHLACPWCSLTYILSASPALGVLGRLRSIFSVRSQSRLIGVSLVLFGALPERITGSPMYTYLNLSFFG